MLYVPADNRFDNNACPVKKPYNNQREKLWFKQTYCLAGSLLLNNAGKKGNREKKKPERYGMHRELFKHFKVWKALKQQFKAVLFYLTEEQQIEDTVQACNCYGAEPENRSNKVYPHSDPIERSNSSIRELSGENGRDKLRSGSKGDNKKPGLVALGCKLNEKVGNGQGESYHCHKIDRRIADLVPFQRGQKPKVKHVS